ncbi:DNA-3-methyladenine glycosylase I [Marinomonas sp. 15G1-11]|uniref:DNA-3-methyladenine glycosylase I n=1 Tax=Marinomonas phaeophyticola TaxID=3004091 RepID=A0ABT4JZ72_9GAMM|nr:DNA-3-methyladenine glycosylase I [Marinomonas sp. 15G1-11]MCZ2723392.1 DNA-3-methyladenine glycosylase I [Marinomonas sp. 15G1-11]
MTENYEPFENIFNRAAARHNGEAFLIQSLSSPLSTESLYHISDDRWLAAMTQKIFQSGINWQVVRNKWEGFEDVFFGFDIEKMTLIADEMWEEKAKDTRIIRHLGKVLTIRDNALMMHDAQQTHGSFAKLVADWPSSDITNLWLYLKKHGKRLGGNTGPYSLRVMGKDTFLLTKDVEGYLRNREIITTGRDTQAALAAAQTAFNYWHEESGLPYCQISQCIAFSVNA